MNKLKVITSTNNVSRGYRSRGEKTKLYYIISQRSNESYCFQIMLEIPFGFRSV